MLVIGEHQELAGSGYRPLDLLRLWGTRSERQKCICYGSRILELLRANGSMVYANESCAPINVTLEYRRVHNSAWPLQIVALNQQINSVHSISQFRKDGIE